MFVLLPIVQAAYYSLFKWNGLQPLTDFIGLKNYQTALAERRVPARPSSNNLLIIVLSLSIQIPFSLALAVLLNRRFPGRAIFRLHVLPAVRPVRGDHRDRLPAAPAARTRWSTRALSGVGLGGLVQDWLGDTTIVMSRCS